MSAATQTTAAPATVSVEEAAEILGIGRSLAYELARAGRIPALRLGKRLVVPRRALDALLAGAIPQAAQARP
jgi:excisionase family DNA binding protein